MSDKTNTIDNADQLLVERVKKGDKRAFDLLVLKYQHRVLAVISRLVADKDSAMDIAQDTFVRAWRAIDKFRGDSAFYTWLYRIATNTAKNWLVAQSRRPRQDVDIDDHEAPELVELSDAATPEAVTNSSQLAAAIAKAMASLPHDLRSALQLREFDGLSYDEIAEALDCPVGTVRSRIFRAREAVNKAIAPYIEDSSASGDNPIAKSTR